jgi:hypothetical protein
MIDLSALTAAVWDRLASDAAGADVRAALGAGATSVLMAEDLRIEGLTVEELPARPLLALRRGAVPVVGRVVNTPVYTWYAYDDIDVGYGQLEALVPLVAAAYQSLLSIGTVGAGQIEVSAGAQTRSQAPALLLCPITVVIGAV